MNEPAKPDDESQEKRDQDTADTPEHMKPENLEKLRDYGKDMIPPGVA